MALSYNIKCREIDEEDKHVVCSIFQYEIENFDLLLIVLNFYLFKINRTLRFPCKSGKDIFDIKDVVLIFQKIPIFT